MLISYTSNKLLNLVATCKQLTPSFLRRYATFLMKQIPFEYIYSKHHFHYVYFSFFCSAFPPSFSSPKTSFIFNLHSDLQFLLSL
ncbi:hypothetical protein VNO77_02416 [Canavalia gladiata]|uniref:Uncharacterized protein n=1 Tax=Canavalia gladiata TaxID=3824 RepID=A0AAN9RBA4_CANGL